MKITFPVTVETKPDFKDLSNKQRELILKRLLDSMTIAECVGIMLNDQDFAKRLGDIVTDYNSDVEIENRRRMHVVDEIDIGPSAVDPNYIAETEHDL